MEAPAVVSSPEFDRAHAPTRRNDSSSRPAVRFVPPLVLLVAVVGAAVPLFGLPASTQEEGTLLEYPMLVLHGAQPYRDFQTVYGPASEWLLGVAYWLFGSSVSTERAIGLGYRLVIVLCVYCLLERGGRTQALFGAALCWWILLPFGLIAYPWVGGVTAALAGLTLLLRAGDTVSGRRAFAAGLLAGLGLLFRPDLALAVVAAFAFWLLRPGSGVHRRSALACAGGVVTALVPYAILSIWIGFGTVVAGIFVDPVIRMEPGRRLPLPPSFHYIGDYFGRVEAYVESHESWFGASLPAQGALLFCAVVAAVAVFGTVVLFRYRAGTAVPAALALWLFICGLLPELLERSDTVHSQFLACLAIPLLPAAWSTTAPVTAAGRPRLALAAAGMAGLAALAVAAPFYTLQSVYDTLRSQSAPVVKSGARALPVGSQPMARDLGSVVSFLGHHARPGQRLFVGPNDLRFANYNEIYVYWLLPQLTPATRYLELNPGLANREGSGLAGQVASSDWIVLSSRFETWSEPNASTRPGPDEPNQIVRTLYSPVFVTGPYTILERDRSGDSR